MAGNFFVRVRWTAPAYCIRQSRTRCLVAPHPRPVDAPRYARVFRAIMSLGIYIQVPFCQTKCSYCNFHTGVVSPTRFAPYASAVDTEIREHRQRLAIAGVDLPPAFPWLVVDTVYFGGGTPSLFDPAGLAAILKTIRETFQTALCEVTLEADPETV